MNEDEITLFIFLYMIFFAIGILDSIVHKDIHSIWKIPLLVTIVISTLFFILTILLYLSKLIATFIIWVKLEVQVLTIY